ncbi:hypothetical protein [Kitasatospora sp. NPDC056181]|uniref:hypothetical protein n=1 Tax=Kitasatospora sp. NPDC056181 TaxID=3345737 RepID=UPI0035DA1940
MASVVSACGGKGSGGGVFGQAFKAFVVGDWRYESTAAHQGVVTVAPDGRWSAEVGKAGGKLSTVTIEGRWEFGGGRLAAHLDWSGPPKTAPCVVPGAPDGVGEGFSGRFPMDNGWSEDLGAATEVTYRNGELTLHFPTYAGFEEVEGAGLTVRCTRRK